MIEKNCNEKNCNETGLYLRIDENLKKNFNIRCLENGTSMSAVIKEYMEKYILE